MLIKLFKNFEIYENIFPIDKNNRKIDIYKFEKCIITGLDLYYPNVLIKNTDDLILPVLEKTMSLNMSTIYEKQNMNYNYIVKNIQNIYNKPLFFFIYNTDNYFHFLYDSLPYLISFLKIKNNISELKLLMQYPNQQKKCFYPFVKEFLEILNITEKDIILVNDNTIYKEIYVSTSYTHDFDSNLPPRKEIYDFYQNIVKNIKNYDNIKTPSKFYISRRTWLHNDFSNIGTNYTTRRKLINEDEIVEKLKQNGFEEVFTEKLSTIEKIIYFSNATHIIGSIGGGIANVLFSKKSTKLEVLVSPTFLDVNNRFKYSLDNVDIYYNMNSKHFEKTNFKTYMRVKIKDTNNIGEIEKIYDNKLLLSCTNGANTGWNSQNSYIKLEVDIKNVEKLDNGLNSPWIFLLDSIKII